VLIAEAEPTVRSLICEALAAGGVRIEIAATASEVLGKVRAAQGRYAALVIDDELPDRGGEVLYRELRSGHHDLPIVIASGARAEELAARLAGDACAAVIARPYTVVQLQETLHAVGVSCLARR